MAEREYKDSEGNVVTLDKLVGYETASDGQWQRDGRIRRFMPTWTYRHGLLVAGLIPSNGIVPREKKGGNEHELRAAVWTTGRE